MSKAVPRAQRGALIPNLTGRGKRVRWRRVLYPSGHAAPPGHLDVSRTALKTSIVRDYRSRCVPQDNLLGTPRADAGLNARGSVQLGTSGSAFNPVQPYRARGRGRRRRR